MVKSAKSVDLLSPNDLFRANYTHQLRQTISAYSDSMIVIGEAIQNAIDAVCEDPKPEKGIISVDVNFDNESVSVQDNGIGFPPNLELLFLGGTQKKGKKTKGSIGVGIKVTLFSSEYFCIQSNNGSDLWKIEINNACNFENLNSLDVPDPLPEDSDPLKERGTRVTYNFVKPNKNISYLNLFVKEIMDSCLPRGIDSGFGESISNLQTGYPSSFATLLSSFLRRYSYIGDVLARLGPQERYPKKGIDINISIQCNDPINKFGKQIGEMFAGKEKQIFTIEPTFLLVEDTLNWVPKGKKAPRIFNDKLGNGGTSLDRTDGFNIQLFASNEDYELLLKNKKGDLPSDTDIKKFREKLFPFINGIILTIGRIPDFDKFLPGGSRRVISCNGVVTSHEIDLIRGRNQEYVRCFDMIIDLNAELNYGKNQLTNTHLVRWVRDYINEAYVRVIQNATGSWVGKIPQQKDEDDEVFVGRDDLGIDKLTTRKMPKDENDAIGLFFELAGLGLFPEYRIFGLSQKATYDCKAAIRREIDGDNVFNPVDDSKLKTVEFKLLASVLIQDFDRFQKFARELDLVIAWDIGNYDSNNFAIYDIDQSDAFQTSPKRVFPRVSKYIYDSKEGSEVQVLILKEIIEDIKSGKIKI